jgi:hypothetical protein
LDTLYYEEFNPDLLPKALDMEADRMRALKIDEENLEQERGIVKEERRLRVDNSPRSKMYEQLKAVAYTAHPYGWPVIGWMSDIDHIAVADCKAYFHTYYAPNNAVLCLTGDFDPAKARPLIETAFGDIPAHEPPAPSPRSSRSPASAASRSRSAEQPRWSPPPRWRGGTPPPGLDSSERARPRDSAHQALVYGPRWPRASRPSSIAASIRASPIWGQEPGKTPDARPLASTGSGLSPRGRPDEGAHQTQTALVGCQPQRAHDQPSATTF